MCIAALAEGGAIDRSRAVDFVVDGTTYTGHAGDTVASALLANGRVRVGDSIYLGNGTRETDAEFKGARDTGIDTQQLASVLGPHPLSPLSGITAYHLVTGG